MSIDEFFSLVGTGKPKRLYCARCGRKGYSQIDRVILCRKCEEIWTESRMSAEHIKMWVAGGAAYREIYKNTKRKRNG